jgi:hypothetical protein
MIDSFLSFPPDPDDSPAEATDATSLRYDDLIQDGRIRLESAWRPTGKLLWGNPEVARVFRSMDAKETNVLSRVTLQASEAVLEPRAKIRTRVSHRFEHTLGKDGRVDRLLFSTWVTTEGRGRDGVFHPASRAYGQRVFTRLEAPPGKHLVTRLDGFGETGVPAHRVRWEPATALLELPAGTTALEPGPRLEPYPVLFGLSHTDLNQHVNFLVYHRAIEQAALSRAMALGVGARLVSREVALGYRKPSFAGESVRVALRAFRRAADDGEPFFGVVAAVVDDDGGPAERARFSDFPSPRVVANMLLRA